MKMWKMQTAKYLQNYNYSYWDYSTQLHKEVSRLQYSSIFQNSKIKLYNKSIELQGKIITENDLEIAWFCNFGVTKRAER